MFDPNAMFSGIRGVITGLFLGLASLSAAVAVGSYVWGNMTNAPQWISRAKKAGWGSVVGYAGVPALGIFQWVSNRITSGGGTTPTVPAVMPGLLTLIDWGHSAIVSVAALLLR
jgi:hypothetical protein